MKLGNGSVPGFMSVCLFVLSSLKTLLDSGSQLAHDRFVTGSLTGRRSLI